ncbi:MAG: cell division protein FtsZ [Sphingomicrobium sp.]
MSIDFMRPEVDELRPRISVIGVGGAGGNAIANMMRADVQGVDFIVANTDAQALNASLADRRIQLGLKITQGLGAGSRPEIGRAAAEETIDEIIQALDGAHMCFIAAGMGGGTGTGAAPVIAKAARDKGILTVGVCTKPFAFEGARRARSADAGINELQQHVDTLIVIPNQNLFRLANSETTFKEAFEMADEVLQQGVRGITDLMVMPGLINLDFADVRSVMSEMGKAMMGTGEAEGDNRAIEAAEKAISNPLLDGVSMKGAKGVIISITGGEDMRLMEVDEAASHIKELVDPDANIIWGSAFNNDLGGKIRVSVVATGIEAEAVAQPAPGKVFTFPQRSSAPTAPAGEAPAVGAAEDEEPLELTEEAGDGDELLLDSEDILTTPVGAPPIAPPEDDEAGETAAAGAGGTLFERMSNIARGAAKAQIDEDEGGQRSDPIDIPRFLNRQNNQ